MSQAGIANNYYCNHHVIIGCVLALFIHWHKVHVHAQCNLAALVEMVVMETLVRYDGVYEVWQRSSCQRHDKVKLRLSGPTIIQALTRTQLLLLCETLEACHVFLMKIGESSSPVH